jgi:type II secretory pathway component PulK
MTSSRPRRGERGSILLLALLVLTLMMVFVADATQVSLVEFEASLNSSNLLKLDAALQYGYESAKAHLRQDEVDSEIDTLAEEWNNPLEITLDDPTKRTDERGRELPTQALGAGGQGSAEAVKVTVEIEDEERKWPLGLLVVGTEAQQRRRRDGLAGVIDAFREKTVMDVGLGDAERMAELIAAFIARKENESSGRVPRARTKSDLHLLNVADLALIPEINDAFMFDQTDEQGNVAPGLLRFLSIHSDLLININTAPLPTLRGLFRADDRIIADNILDYRQKQDQELLRDEGSLGARLGRETGSERRDASDKPGGEGARSDDQNEEGGGAVFEKTDDVKKVTGFSQIAQRETASTIAVDSHCFSIWATATLGRVSRTRHWIVRREAGNLLLVLSERIDQDFRPRYRIKEEEGAEGVERRKQAAERTKERRESR